MAATWQRAQAKPCRATSEPALRVQAGESRGTVQMRFAFRRRRAVLRKATVRCAIVACFAGTRAATRLVTTTHLPFDHILLALVFMLLRPADTTHSAAGTPGEQFLQQAVAAAGRLAAAWTTAASGLAAAA